MMQSETVTSPGPDLAVVKQQIADILQVPNSPEWKIVDDREDKNLYLIHYERDADMTRFGGLRGIAVDIAARAVVSRGFGYTPTAVADTIAVGPDGKVQLDDEHGITHTLDAATFVAMTGWEATAVFMFKH